MGRGKEAPSAEAARETIRAAIKAGVEPSVDAAAAVGPRRPAARASDKPLWKGTATLARTDLAALPQVPDLNLKVLEFAREHVGQKVGSGECWTLANDALKAAGAKGADGYTFGRELRDGEPALPGDIVQFTSVRLEHANGSWQTLGHPNHTAMVVKADNQVYQVLHQNMGGVKIVGPAKLGLRRQDRGKNPDLAAGVAKPGQVEVTPAAVRSAALSPASHAQPSVAVGITRRR